MRGSLTFYFVAGRRYDAVVGILPHQWCLSAGLHTSHHHFDCKPGSQRSYKGTFLRILLAALAILEHALRNLKFDLFAVYWNVALNKVYPWHRNISWYIAVVS